MEGEYLRGWGERLPTTWLPRMEELGLVTTHLPLPDSVRCVVFPAASSLVAALPPAPALPAEEVWEVVVTTVSSVAALTVRLLGNPWAGKLDTLLGDMDLHYYQVGLLLPPLLLLPSPPPPSSPSPPPPLLLPLRTVACPLAPRWEGCTRRRLPLSGTV